MPARELSPPYTPARGDVVVASPVGPGEVTGFSRRGFPEVNEITVAWVEGTGGRVFDPWGVRPAVPRVPADAAEDWA